MLRHQQDINHGFHGEKDAFNKRYKSLNTLLIKVFFAVRGRDIIGRWIF